MGPARTSIHKSPLSHATGTLFFSVFSEGKPS